MKTVCWLIDCPGWAFDQMADHCILRMPEFVHIKVLKEDIKRISDTISTYDVVVCFFPQYLLFLKSLHNVVLRIDGNRALDNEDFTFSGKYNELELGTSVSSDSR
jgi:hypothetical protein